ncbi:hypothetical protein A9Q99_02280 [Gammaproteobacteria bacterium 45_16_T64]|nr:hypothetical protein A9Q99_02280 [Gammaproteobacteria bacterium 45_16_T64]
MIYLNHLSFDDCDELTKEIYEGLYTFLNKEKNNPNIEICLCSPINKPNENYGGNISIKELLSNCLDSEIRGILLSIFTSKIKPIGDYESEYLCHESGRPYKALDYYLDCDDSPKFLSLHTTEYWESYEVKIVSGEREISIINSAKLNFNDFGKLIQRSASFIRNWVNRQLGGDHEYLPKIKAFHEVVPPLFWELYKIDYKTPSKKIEAIRQTGKLIATSNGYEYDRRLSSKNSNPSAIRDIYFSNNLELFISVDVAHGRFEVLNKNGVHMAEIDFEGKITQSADTERKHNIEV